MRKCDYSLRSYEKQDQYSPDFNNDDMINAFRRGFKSAMKLVTPQRDLNDSDIIKKLHAILVCDTECYMFEPMTDSTFDSMEYRFENMAGDDWACFVMPYSWRKNSVYVEFRNMKTGGSMFFVIGGNIDVVVVERV
jgi:hypothetical protein